MREIVMRERHFAEILEKYKRENRAYKMVYRNGKKYFEGDWGDKIIRLVGEKEAERKISKDDKVESSNLGVLVKLFQDSVDRYLLGCDFHLAEIGYKGIMNKINREYYRELPIGGEFVSIDIVSCYWQMAYKLGYIDKDMYDKYMNNSRYKQAKRLCVALLGRPFIKKYVIPKKGIDMDVSCDMGLYKTMFKNIRDLAYTHIQECCEIVDGKYYWRNIDCIAVDFQDYKKVSEFFKSKNIKISISYAVKIDNYICNNGGKIKVIERRK
jgi:hypothetical protein